MNSTDTVSVLESRIEMLESERTLLTDELARAKMPLRQTLIDAKLKSIDAEIDYLRDRKQKYE